MELSIQVNLRTIKSKEKELMKQRPINGLECGRRDISRDKASRLVLAQSKSQKMMK
jgi:hypothetical protein